MRTGKLRRRVSAVLTAMALCAALAAPAGAQTTACDSTDASAASALGAQTVSVKTSYVGIKEVFEYLPSTDGSSVKYTLKADVTGDNKKDKITVKMTSDEYDYLTKIVVKVKGKKALTVKLDSWAANYATVSYVRQSKSKEFIYLYASGDDDYTQLSKIYKYNKKKGKFKCVANFNTCGTRIAQLTSVTKKKIKVTYETQPCQTGYIGWKYTYVYKNGKFKKVSNKGTAYSLLESFDSSVEPYKSYFAENKYVTQKKLKLYKSPGSSKVSATIAANKVVTLKKACYKNGNLYLKFKKGDKTGWVKVDYSYDDSSMNWFYGIGYAG